MIPNLDVCFPFDPLRPTDTKDTLFQVQDYTLPMSEQLFREFINYASGLDRDKPTEPEERERFEELMSIAGRVYTPSTYIIQMVKKKVGTNIPVTNAFLKLFECLHHPLIKSYLLNLNELTAVFLADFPGTFYVSTNYFLALYKPAILLRDKYHYKATTLPMDIEDALQDQYGLYAGTPENWFFMDHNSYDDTQKMRTYIGDGTADLVTGDIGKPLVYWEDQEHEMFLEEYGQIISALLLMKNGACAILKMFQAFYPATMNMIRLAQAFCEEVHIYKPATSRVMSNEVYWLLIGFKRDLFVPHIEEIMNVLKREHEHRNKYMIGRNGPDGKTKLVRMPKEGYARPFIPRELLSEDFLRRVLVFGHAKNMRLRDPADKSSEFGREMFKRGLSIEDARRYANAHRLDSTKIAEEWLAYFPIAPIADTLKKFKLGEGNPEHRKK